MRHPIRCILVAIVVAFTVVACTAVDLSQLNTRYELLLQRKQTADSRKPGNKIDIALESDSESIEAGFLDVTRQATAAGDKADEKATKIAAYRLATVSAWQARAPYAEPQAKGIALCQSSQAAIAPRDCAVLAYVPVLAAYEQIATTFNPAAKSAAQAEQLLTQAETMMRPQTDNLAPILRGQGPYAGIGVATQSYFRKVTLATACQTESLLRYINTLPDDTPQKDALATRAATAAARYRDLLETAGYRWNNPNLWFTEGRC